MDCVFCKIIAEEITAAKIYEDEYVIAINDINPQAPVHILIMPKAHICCADEITEENGLLVGKCFEAAAKIAAKQGITNGYRIINNCGEDACQTVRHIHFHLIAGKKLSENIAF